MVAFEERLDQSISAILSLSTQAVANTEKKVPREWIDENGTGLKQEFIDYALPLIQGESAPPMVNSLPRFAKLKKVLATEPAMCK